MKHVDTESGMFYSPDLGEYFWTYLIHVECKECKRNATIAADVDTDEPILKCNQCGWSETLTGQKCETLLTRIKRGIAGLDD